MKLEFQIRSTDLQSAIETPAILLGHFPGWHNATDKNGDIDLTITNPTLDISVDLVVGTMDLVSITIRTDDGEPFDWDDIARIASTFGNKPL